MVLDHLNAQSFKDNSNIEKEYQKLYKKYANKYSGYKLDMTIKQHLYQKGYDATDIEKIIK
jgi:SOS response regulatory protein OraA/RecX